MSKSFLSKLSELKIKPTVDFYISCRLFLYDLIINRFLNASNLLKVQVLLSGNKKPPGKGGFFVGTNGQYSYEHNSGEIFYYMTS